MAIQLGSKLIWQEISPAPFESAWSIFSKVQALNTMSPSRVHSMIADPARKDSNSRELDFRNSSWIDFDRFSNALGVNENRLRSAFLDQLGFTHWDHSPIPGIKVCRDCLEKGYHSVFFELGFVDICPWHYKKLDMPCDYCRSTVFRSGLEKRKNQIHGVNVSEGAEWRDLHSSCEHIQFNDGRVGKSNGFSRVEEEAVYERCAALLRWWKVVSTNPEIAAFLSRYSFDDPHELRLRMMFGAAEQLAGKCPWPVGISRGPVRTQRWLESKRDAVDNVGGRVPRASDWDVVYRSVRRQIFSRYVRPHRDCWKELSSYWRYDTKRLDSDTCCPVSLAYAAWRMSVEHLRNFEALKSDKLKSNPILAMQLNWPQPANSLRAHASLLYAYFFSIWGEILRHVGVDSFAIADSNVQWNRDLITAMYSPHWDSCSSGESGGEWTIVISEPKALQRKSLVRCCGRLKQKYWMISSQTQEHWTDIYWGGGTDYGQPIFKLRKFELGRSRATYKYICI